jgi:citrate lyase subunit beta / citryl-CoA lyase
MRPFLIVPADNANALEAARHSGAAALLLRLGAAGEQRQRDAARRGARDFITAMRRVVGRPSLYVQVASARGAALADDLGALAGRPPDGFFLEECQGRADVQQFSVKLAAVEACAGLTGGATRIVALAAQTPAGVFALGSYAGASSRLAGLALDETSLPGGAQGRATARALLALGAAAAGIPALEIAPREIDGHGALGAQLEEACAAARRDGFSGILAFSADQIGAVNAAWRAR